MRVLVCVTGQKTCERLIVEGAKLAKACEGELSVLHVARAGADFLGNPVESEAIEYLYQISSAHGADMSLVRAENVMDTLVSCARKLGADKIVVGASGRGRRWHEQLDFADELRARMPDAEICVAYAPGDGA